MLWLSPPTRVLFYFGLFIENEFTHTCKYSSNLMVLFSFHKEGIGMDKNHAAIRSIDDEHLFWELGVLGWSTPKFLQLQVSHFMLV